LLTTTRVWTDGAGYGTATAATRSSIQVPGSTQPMLSDRRPPIPRLRGRRFGVSHSVRRRTTEASRGRGETVQPGTAHARSGAPLMWI
jgi:hypothetical protein